jgi:acyl-CoA dehydrogenase
VIVDGDVEGLVDFADVPLAADRVLGEPDGGTAVVEWLVTHGTVGLCALQAGVSAESLQMTARYATGRVQFDRPIATYQAVGQRLADCYIDVEAIRLTLWQALGDCPKICLPQCGRHREVLGGRRGTPCCACRGARARWNGY